MFYDSIEMNEPICLTKESGTMNNNISQRHNYDPHNPNDLRKPGKLKWKRVLLWLCILILVVTASIIVPKYWDIWEQNLIPSKPMPTRTPQPTATAAISVISSTAAPSPSSSQTSNLKTDRPSPTSTPMVPLSDDWNYVDSDIEIHVKNEKVDGHSIYTADIKLKDASFIHTAFAKDKYGDFRDHTSVMAQQNNAILAINGDFYGFRNTGIIIRGGKLYRNKPHTEMAALYKDGRLLVMDEKGIDGEQLLKDGVNDTWSFGPWLIKDGETRTDFSFSNMQVSNPRTGIGMIEPNHFIFIVIDGRSEESTGITLADFAKTFETAGCKQAYNLDGGGSATLYFNGRVVNNPLGKVVERAVSDIIYIAKTK